MPAEKKSKDIPEQKEVLKDQPDPSNKEETRSAPAAGSRESDWNRIAEELAKPFDASHIRVKPGKVAANGQALALWYVDARAVMDRLDAVVGPENWEFTWTPIRDGDRVVVQGVLTVRGVSKSDVGEAKDEDEPWKSGVSDAFKRTAVQFGIGRFLYRLPQLWWPYDVERRRFEREDELLELVNKVVHELENVGGDISQIKAKDYTARDQRQQTPEPDRQHQGSGVGETATKGGITPAQDAYIRRLYGQKFARYSNGNVLFANFLRRTIGRTCNVEKLTRQEADTVIKAMQEIGTANAA